MQQLLYHLYHCMLAQRLVRVNCACLATGQHCKHTPLQAAMELQRLVSNTLGAAGSASQGALNRQQMADLLQYASGAGTT